MAQILLKKEDIIRDLSMEELNAKAVIANRPIARDLSTEESKALKGAKKTLDQLNSTDSPYWQSFDPISQVHQNVMYYAFDIKKVFEQAKGAAAIPVFLEVKLGKTTGTVLALKKENPVEGELAYHPLAAGGWPPIYETIDDIFAPARIIVSKKEELVEKDEGEIA